MTDIPLAYGASKRTGFAEAVFENCLVEKAETQVRTDLAILSRPGLEGTFATIGGGPIRGAFQRDGVFGGDAIILSGTTLYRVSSDGSYTTFSGTVSGDGYVTIDAGQNSNLDDVARVATGSALYATNPADSTVAAEDFPSAEDNVGASSVCFHRMYFFATKAGTDQVYYRSSTDTVWQALSFVSAEYQPDRVQAIRSLGDQFAFLGSSTVEWWYLSGTADPAVQPSTGLNFNYGCRAGLTAVVLESSLLWVDDTGAVRRSEGGDGKIVSTPSINERINRVVASDLTASGFSFQGHYYYVLHLRGVETWVYDIASGDWIKFKSKDYDYWRPKFFCSIGDSVIAADTTTAKLWKVSANALDDDGDEITRRFMAFDEIEQTTPVYNLVLDCETGTALRSGQGSNPVIRMRFSDTNGLSWSNWSEASLGSSGEHLRVIWRRLGTVRGPGRRMWQFEVSDPIVTRFTSLKRNVDL